jgi:hypothetical protein
MATEYTLKRADGQAFGTFAEVEARIRQLFPAVEFWWSRSGAEKIRMARERGVEMPEELRRLVEKLPPLREGVAESPDYHVTFGLGPAEPVTCLCVVPRGMAEEMDRGLAALEADAGAQLKVATDD